MSLIWIILATILCVISAISLCFWLLHKASDDSFTTWFLEHIACPIIRILALLTMVSLLYPGISTEASSIGFWRILFQHNHINDTINILFFGSLVLAFLPIASHPVFTLPLQSCLSIALVFSWQYGAELHNYSSLIPGIGDWLKIIFYMTGAYFITRHSSVVVARRVDQKMQVTGSIRLVSDSIYLVLQIPIILAYCSLLSRILPSSGGS